MPNLHRPRRPAQPEPQLIYARSCGSSTTVTFYCDRNLIVWSHFSRNIFYVRLSGPRWLDVADQRSLRRWMKEFRPMPGRPAGVIPPLPECIADARVVGFAVDGYGSASTARRLNALLSRWVPGLWARQRLDGTTTITLGLPESVLPPLAVGPRNGTLVSVPLPEHGVFHSTTTVPVFCPVVRLREAGAPASLSSRPYVPIRALVAAGMEYDSSDPDGSSTVFVSDGSAHGALAMGWCGVISPPGARPCDVDGFRQGGMVRVVWDDDPQALADRVERVRVAVETMRDMSGAVGLVESDVFATALPACSHTMPDGSIRRGHVLVAAAATAAVPECGSLVSSATVWHRAREAVAGMIGGDPALLSSVVRSPTADGTRRGDVARVFCRSASGAAPAVDCGLSLVPDVRSGEVLLLDPAATETFVRTALLLDTDASDASDPHAPPVPPAPLTVAVLSGDLDQARRGPRFAGRGLVGLHVPGADRLRGALRASKGDVRAVEAALAGPVAPGEAALATMIGWFGVPTVVVLARSLQVRFGGSRYAGLTILIAPTVPLLHVARRGKAPASVQAHLIRREEVCP